MVTKLLKKSKWLAVLLFLFAMPVCAQPVELQKNGLLGFRNLVYELVINPCVSDEVLLEEYGKGALPLAKKERSHWPKNLCQNPKLAEKLLQWRYNSTWLLAHTDNPLRMDSGISLRESLLSQCASLTCIDDYLDRFNRWSNDNLEQNTKDGQQSKNRTLLEGDALVNPKMALRDLKLPMPNQGKKCGDLDISVLHFNIAQINHIGQTIVQVSCGKRYGVSNHEVFAGGTWLIEYSDSQNKAHWREILQSTGNEVFYVLGPSADTNDSYPMLYSRRKDKQYEYLSVYSYSDQADVYTKVLDLLVAFDFKGRTHAFPSSLGLMRKETN